MVGKAGAVFPEESDASVGSSGDVGVGYDFLTTGPGILAVEATIGYANSSTDFTLVDGLNAKGDVDIVPFALTLKAGGMIGDRIRLYAGAGLDLVYALMDVSASTRINGGTMAANASDAELLKVYAKMLEIVAKVRAVKVFLTDDKKILVFQTEFYLKNPEDFHDLFPRNLSAIESGIRALTANK